jgi:hypothetical protein
MAVTHSDTSKPKYRFIVILSNRPPEARERLGKEQGSCQASGVAKAGESLAFPLEPPRVRAH